MESTGDKRKYDDSTSPSSPPSQTGFDSDDSKGPAGKKPYVPTSSAPVICKKIEIPNGKECWFIGDKGAEVIDYLQNESGAKIQVLEDSCSTRTFELTGNADAINEAERIIMDLLYEVELFGRLSGNFSDIIYKKIEIPTRMVDLVMSERDVDVYQRQFGVRLRVTRDPHSPTTTVEIIGDAKHIAVAEEMILSIVAEEETNMKERLKDECQMPNKFSLK